jgi:hypothetical protein
MRINYLLIFSGLLLLSCSGENSHEQSKKFLEECIVIIDRPGKDGGVFRVPDIQNVKEANPYYQIQIDNDLMFNYLKVNLLWDLMPDSITFSHHLSRDMALEHFFSVLFKNEDFLGVVSNLLNPNPKTYTVSIDSLVQMASRLFFVTNEGKNQMGLSLCVGNNPFVEIYSRDAFIETFTIQAFCFQSLMQNRTQDVSDLWKVFEENFHKALDESPSLPFDERVRFVQNAVQEKMRESMLLRKRLIDSYEAASVKHFTLLQ